MTKGAVHTDYYRKFYTKRFWAVDVPKATGGDCFRANYNVAVQYSTGVGKGFFQGETQVVLSMPPSPDVPSVGELGLQGFKFKDPGDTTSESGAESD